MFEFLGMKKLLLATILLSSAAYGDIDVVTDIRRAALSYLGTGKQVSRGDVRIDEDKSLPLPFLTAARRTRGNRGISQHDPSYRLSPDKLDYHRCTTNPTTVVSVNVRDLLKKKDQLSTYNSEICAYFQEQGWKVENPMYVDEPSWIEIANNYAYRLPHRLELIDPFILSRGKRIRWWKNTKKNDGTNDGDTIANEPKETDRIRRKRDYRMESGSRSRRGSSIVNAVFAREKNSRLLGQKNKHLALQDLFEQPYFISRGKKAKHRLNIEKLGEQRDRIKSAVNDLPWNEGNDHVSNQFAKTLESNSKSRDAEHFERAFARKRMKSSSDRKSLLDQLLTDSDLYYVGRGKRTSTALAAESTETV